MTIEKDCSRVPYGILQVTFFTFLSFTVTMVVVMLYMRNIWASDWNAHRCSLHVMPFASIVKPGTSTRDNFNECVQMKVKPIMTAYTQSKLDAKVAETVAENVKTHEAAKESAEEVNKSGEAVKSKFSGLFKAYEHMVNILGYIGHKIQNFFYKIGAIVWTLYFLLISQVNTVMIQIAQLQKTLGILNALVGVLIALTVLFPLWGGLLLPLTVIMIALYTEANLAHEAAKKRAYCCFTKDTKIGMKNGSEKEIQEIVLGDKVSKGGEVTGIVKMKGDIDVVEMKNGTCVTDSHLFYNVFDKWEYVEDWYGKHKKTDEVCCLVTMNNRIVSGKTLFCDYEEVSDSDIQCKIAKLISKQITNNTRDLKPNCEYELGERNNCLPKGTSVMMRDGYLRPIESLEIGEKTSCGKIIGKYICDAKGIFWNDVNGTIVSPRLFCSIFSNPNFWVKGYEVGHATTFECDVGYHLITETHEIELDNGVFVRDFVETDDEKTQDAISILVKEYLNSE